VTPLARRMHATFGRLVGCEYLDDGTTPLGGTNDRNTRNEDFTCLTFGDQQFERVFTFDMLEHIPDYRAALAECHRVLARGGQVMCSVPFRLDLEQHLVRARVDADGNIEHLLKPEYHGDPLKPEGCLSFYTFGWALLDDLRDAGFKDPRLYLYWSSDFAY